MSCAIDAEEFFPFSRIGDACHIIVFIFIEQLQFFAVCRIHSNECHFVSMEVRRGKDFLVVGREFHETDDLFEVRGQDLAELFLLAVAIEDLRVHTIDDGGGDAQTSLMVSHPTLNVSRVFRQHRQFSGLGVQAIGVKNLRVAAIQSDEDKTGLLLEVINQDGANPLKISVGTEVCSVGTDSEETKVFVSSDVFHEKDAVVFCPHVATDATFRFAGETH